MKTKLTAICLLLAACAYAQNGNDTAFTFQKVYWERNGGPSHNNAPVRLKMQVDAAGNMEYSYITHDGKKCTKKGRISEAQLAVVVKDVKQCNPAAITAPKTKTHAIVIEGALYNVDFYCNNTKKSMSTQMISKELSVLMSDMNKMKDEAKMEKVSDNY